MARPGFNFWAKEIAASCWGITVPKIEVTARMIRRTMVKRTELKNAQIGFVFEGLVNFFLTTHMIK